ncbi:hypothetical protein [Streptomyces purpureus]|uniref:hypothetical protein n=1 Tax=Streptomyces purpureus TaxID=1951 RepID=UPI0003811EF1|nr:hypothetical protein [Streptomyces purpureus]
MSSVQLLQNVTLDDLATGADTTSATNEPTVARFLDHVLMTGNTFASHSVDGGASWTHLDPFTEFPHAAGGFCCDQIVIHHRGRNLWFRVLQYDTGPGGAPNIVRLAVSTNGTPAPGSWTTYDFAPQDFDSAWQTGTQLDRPDIATSSRHLFMTMNVFRENWLATVVMRIPLADLEAHAALNLEYYTLDANFGQRSSVCLTHGATTDMYMMGAEVGNPVRIFRWPDAPGSAMSQFDISTTLPWTGSLRQGDYISICPNGATNWLRKQHSRPAGWVTGNRVGFMWNALPNATRPQPWIKTLIADTTTMTVVAEPDLWSDIAWAYPAPCPNVNGVVGVSLFVGGVTLNPRHAVGFLDNNQWVLVATADSNEAPRGFPWGDYVSCATNDPDGTQWVASGYSLQGGFGGRFVEPQYVRFAIGP